MRDRLLLVEDNALNSKLLSHWLESEGFDVDVADSLAAAHAALEANPIQLVLLDVRVGAEDGLDLARWLRSESRLSAMPIIAVTAHALRSEQERIIKNGCNAVISKPVNFAELRHELDLWLHDSKPRVG